jgi:hypothetical protein
MGKSRGYMKKRAGADFQYEVKTICSIGMQEL